MLIVLIAAMLVTGADYPRVANLWGSSPAAADTETWARYDLLVAAGGSDASWRRFAGEAREINPDIQLLGTAPLMNISGPDASPWMQPEWFLKRPTGEAIRWWADQIYTPNLFIDPCLAALAEQTEIPYGTLLRDGVVDGVFYDSVVGNATWLGDVDTDIDGVADLPANVDDRWSARQNEFFDTVRGEHPDMLILANDVDSRHAPHVNGRLFEGAPLLDRVANGSISPRAAARILNEWTEDSMQPPITFAIMTYPLGWQGFRVGQGPGVTTEGEVERTRRDFARMRLGLLTTLMSDAYFAYDFGTVWYGLPLWYAEYDAPLGEPLGDAYEAFDVPPVSVLDWSAGDDTGLLNLPAVARVTTEGIEAELEDADAPWHMLFGTDPKKLPLEPGKSYRVEAECEILEPPTGTLQFHARTAIGGYQDHDKARQFFPGGGLDTWRVEATITPDGFPDYAVEWHMHGSGRVRLTKLTMSIVNESYMVREFEGGKAILNTTARPITVPLDTPMLCLSDEQAPLHAMEVDDTSSSFTSHGAWEDVRGEGHFYGAGFRMAAKPGDRAEWMFEAPSTDRYTVSACIPKDDRLTDAAAYAFSDERAMIDQREGDGGWFEMFSADLVAGESYVVALTSAGAGATAADAIRIESAARYNDGAEVAEVTLGPLDGRLLLKR